MDFSKFEEENKQYCFIQENGNKFLLEGYLEEDSSFKIEAYKLSNKGEGYFPEIESEKMINIMNFYIDISEKIGAPIIKLSKNVNRLLGKENLYLLKRKNYSKPCEKDVAEKIFLNLYGYDIGEHDAIMKKEDEKVYSEKIKSKYEEMKEILTNINLDSLKIDTENVEKGKFKITFENQNKRKIDFVFDEKEKEKFYIVQREKTELKENGILTVYLEKNLYKKEEDELEEEKIKEILKKFQDEVVKEEIEKNINELSTELQIKKNASKLKESKFEKSDREIRRRKIMKEITEKLSKENASYGMDLDFGFYEDGDEDDKKL